LCNFAFRLPIFLLSEMNVQHSGSQDYRPGVRLSQKGLCWGIDIVSGLWGRVHTFTFLVLITHMKLYFCCTQIYIIIHFSRPRRIYTMTKAKFISILNNYYDMILRHTTLTFAAYTLNGFDDQERSLTFVKTDFQVLKLKFHVCNFK